MSIFILKYTNSRRFNYARLNSLFFHHIVFQILNLYCKYKYIVNKLYIDKLKMFNLIYS